MGVVVTIPLFAAKTSANVALAKSQLNAAEFTVGNKRQEVRLDVQQKARSVRELDATREVARLDLKLAQETVELAQARFDQGRATLQEIEQARLDESDKWIAFLGRRFCAGTGAAYAFAGDGATWQKCYSSKQSETVLGLIAANRVDLRFICSRAVRLSFNF